MIDDPSSRMTAADVREILGLLEERHVTVWLDGGWGVDALLGRQTREHADLDIEVTSADTPAAVDALTEQGFVHTPRDDDRPWNFVMSDPRGRQVDFHVITFDERGNGLYGPDEFMFTAASLSGAGLIDGHKVRCLSAEFQLASHGGYALDADDLADIAALCEHFGLELPPL